MSIHPDIANFIASGMDPQEAFAKAMMAGIPPQFRKSGARWHNPDAPRKPAGNAGGQAVAAMAKARRETLAPKVMALVSAGHSVKAIANQVGMSCTTVRVVISENGGRKALMGRPPARDEKADAIRALADQGQCLRHIAKALQMGEGTIKKVAHDHGIAIPHGKAGKGEPVTPEERVEKVAQVIKLRKEGLSWRAISEQIGRSRPWIKYALKKQEAKQ